MTQITEIEETYTCPCCHEDIEPTEYGELELLKHNGQVYHKECIEGKVDKDTAYQYVVECELQEDFIDYLTKQDMFSMFFNEERRNEKLIEYAKEDIEHFGEWWVKNE